MRPKYMLWIVVTVVSSVWYMVDPEASHSGLSITDSGTGGGSPMSAESVGPSTWPEPNPSSACASSGPPGKGWPSSGARSACSMLRCWCRMPCETSIGATAATWQGVAAASAPRSYSVDRSRASRHAFCRRQPDRPDLS